MSLEKLLSEYEILSQEKNELSSFLGEWSKEFQRTHSRKVTSSTDRMPVQGKYDRYLVERFIHFIV